MEKMVFVGQRELGIIAPAEDIYSASLLSTDKMLMCYALSLRDEEADVGLLTHVDPIGEFTLKRAIKKASPVLKELGVRRMRVETANTLNRSAKDNTISGAVRALEENDIEVVPIERDGIIYQWSDVGAAFGVIFTAKDGMRTYSADEFYSALSTEEYEEISQASDVKGFLRAVPRLTLNPFFRVAYQPAIHS